jgi:hypothetical protein
MSSTGAAGTFPANSAIHSAVVRAANSASSSAFSAARWASRAVKSAKRGSAAQSGRPTRSASTRQNFSLLHMMKIQPSLVG